MICEYGCGREARYQFKNKKWCCENHYSKCPQKRKENDGGKRFSKKLIQKLSNIAKQNTGKNNPFYGKKHSSKTKLRIKIIQKLSIKTIKCKYPTFSKIEQIRYNPDKPGEKEIQVRCKNHNCPNSKEKNGWFSPSYSQIYERIRSLEHIKGSEGSYFYCCDECKMECPLYSKKVSSLIKLDQIKAGIISEPQYTDEEYNTWRQEVLERADYKCEYCGELAEHAHHSRPQKLEPFFSLDPDYGIACCVKCHYKNGHRDECSTESLANIICYKQKDRTNDTKINNKL